MIGIHPQHPILLIMLSVVHTAPNAASQGGEPANRQGTIDSEVVLLIGSVPSRHITIEAAVWGPFFGQLHPDTCFLVNQLKWTICALNLPFCSAPAVVQVESAFEFCLFYIANLLLHPPKMDKVVLIHDIYILFLYYTSP